MTNEQRTMILTGVKAGVEMDKIAETIGVEAIDVKIYISWWQDRGCPDLTF